MKKLLILLIILILLTGCGAGTNRKQLEDNINEKFLGEWEGNIEIPLTPLTINLKLDKSDGSLSVPEQGLKNYPLESIYSDGNMINIVINFKGSKIKIVGELKRDRIDGTFIQNGQTYLIELKPFEEQPLL
ncbi:hypothetical protein [Rummeliibacillus pycnus]|uniref:hypothetical protein n=1 Tax=Rummeliibacillus pycnus TaxID=101070 RepID=UPI000C9C1723|nr:hypothetical protein [Rummeliibacillus pycnus]